MSTPNAAGGAAPGAASNQAPPSNSGGSGSIDLSTPTKGQPQKRERLRIDQLEMSSIPDQRYETVEPDSSEQGEPELEATESDDALPVDDAENESEEVQEEQQGPEYEQLLAMMNDPVLNDAFMEKLVTVPGNDEQVTVAEAVAGYMMQRDYSRKTTEAAAIKRQAQAQSQSVNAFIQDLSQPKTFRQAIYQADQLIPGIADAYEQDAQNYLVEERRLFNELGGDERTFNLYKEKMKIERNNQRLQRQLQQRELQERQVREQEQANTPDAMAVNFGKQLDQLVPRAFKEIGQENHALAQSLIGSYIFNFYQDTTKPLDYAAVRNACKAVQQHLRESYKESTKKPARGQPAPHVPRLPAGPGKSNGNHSGQRRPLRIDELPGNIDFGKFR